MASHWYTQGLADCLNGAIDLDSNTIKVMLVNSTYTPNKDDDVVDTGGGTDAESAEITATNYARGWGAAGRKTVTVTVTVQDANDRVVVILSDPSWTALGGAVNDTIVGAIVIKEGGANDTTSRLIAYLDLTDTPTNGSNVTIDHDATDGNLRITT